jgi:hypothetical protein
LNSKQAKDLTIANETNHNKKAKETEKIEIKSNSK